MSGTRRSGARKVRRSRTLMVKSEDNPCEPKCTFIGDARSVDCGTVAEEHVDGERIEPEEILRQWNAREAASQLWMIWHN